MEWRKLRLHEIIRMWHLIPWLMVFILLSGRGRQGEVMKNDLSLVFLADWDLFPNSLDR